jgi:predicted GIY-YIG superfamily endonuclease
MSLSAWLRSGERECVEGQPTRFFTYVLLCADGSYYVGHTRNIWARLRAHRQGKAAGHTARHRPFKLVHLEENASEKEAMARERQIKRWSRAKKRALSTGSKQRLKDLSRSRD